MIKRVSNKKISNWQEFYLPNKPVIPKKAESTKLQIVYDTLEKSETRFSLNECLEEQPTLQNKLWDVLVSSRFYPVNLCTDIEKAFWQIDIRERKRYFLRFHWIEATNNDEIEIYCFTSLMFGPTQSLFILDGTWMLILITVCKSSARLLKK